MVGFVMIARKRVRGDDLRRGRGLGLDDVDVPEAVIGDVVVDIDDGEVAIEARGVVLGEIAESPAVRAVDQAEHVIRGQLVPAVD